MLGFVTEEGSLGLTYAIAELQLELERRAPALEEAVWRERQRREAAQEEAAARRREAALREAAAVSEAAEPESVVAQHASTWRQRECDFCGRSFHSYGQLLNHKCQGGEWSRQFRGR